LSAGSVTVTASIGVATGAVDGADRLLRDADLAMYRAKAAGKNFIVSFEEGMGQGVDSQLALEMGLAEALRTGDQIEVHYQPVVSLSDERTVGAEALVRWRHPEHGLLPPLDFIPLAEETGMILELGRLVLRSACAQGAVWQQDDPDFHISVNVSARQLEDARFPHHVAEAIAESGVDATRVILELTESAVIRNAAAAQRLNALKRLGVRLAIDDFGTGYASLSSLRDLPIDILKIDRSFVVAMSGSPEGSALMSSLIDMGRALNLETIAEGVEEQAQIEELRDRQCDAVQGFFYGRPVPAAELQPSTPRDANLIRN